MRILIIGGTYFLGKAFLKLCDQEKNEIAVINRGYKTVPNNEDGHIRTIICDRRDAGSLEKIREELPWEQIDAVVDFCAYGPGEIRMLFDAIPQKIGHYIFISTADVYRRGTGKALGEDAELETRDFGGQEGEYILGKAALEKEVKECAGERQVPYTSVRPVTIYGQDNYAPREGLFFHWMQKAGQVLFPEDADGTFQMVYVRDAAECIYRMMGNQKFYNEGVNLCNQEKVTYDLFVKALEYACGFPLVRVGVTVADVLERDLPLPFALTSQESDWYLGDRVEQLGVRFCTLEEGLRETYRWFLGQSEMREGNQT
ncbi:MAG: NAD-dependent epimerase/dehydratase family protein [Lachnospiraceae bacterium]|nr:NAD-dependent epimerase/dehydratase family protein [Lachnospiraceae bacterium]